MASQVSYSTNPRSYAQLLAAGVSPAQIREAINSGLNPAQLPPEYFGMTSGWTPQSVGPGAPSSQELGGIDIPPADMNDPYGYPFMGSSATASAGAGYPAQASGWASVGDPFSSAQASGSYGALPTASLARFPIVDFSNQGSSSVGGNMTFGGYGGIQPTGLDLYGAPIDYGYLPSSNQYGWSPVDYGTPSSFDSSSYGAYSTGSGALPYSEPSPIPFTDPSSPSVGGDMSLGGYGTTPTGAAGMQFQTDPSAEGTVGDFSYVPQLGYNTYDAGDGTTYVYDSDWNYLYTQQTPQAGAGTTGTPGLAPGGGTIGGAGAAGGTAGGPGSWSPTGYGSGSPFGAGWAGMGGAGFGGYGGLGGSGAPQYWSSSAGVNTATDISHGGVDPTSQGGEGIGGGGGFGSPNMMASTLKIDAPTPQGRLSVLQSKKGGG